MINIANNYIKVLEVLNSLEIEKPTNKAGRKPKMTDLEVIALIFTAEYMSMDSENSLFRHLHNVDLPNLIERSQYNKRRRNLFGFAEKIRRLLASKFVEFEEYFIVDSMPLEIYKIARQRRVKVCSRHFDTAPAKGFCASQNNWFYGYKLHGVCSISGVFHSIDITKANVHDICFLQDINTKCLIECRLATKATFLQANK